MKKISKIKALKYIVDNAKTFNEWAEAGAYHAVCTIILSENRRFTEDYLIELLKKAENF